MCHQPMVQMDRRRGHGEQCCPLTHRRQDLSGAPLEPKQVLHKVSRPLAPPLSPLSLSRLPQGSQNALGPPAGLPECTGLSRRAPRMHWGLPQGSQNALGPPAGLSRMLCPAGGPREEKKKRKREIAKRQKPLLTAERHKRGLCAPGGPTTEAFREDG
ncbi:hypothetical protein NHX12_030371 [Muraenolepis orangiensis]|uniref:Uncharacterized protein n=1 Tax=Muraenolepis orangiensis TaxID=630683 RepID=A0A9Q0IJC1_9TELE|nr:hypothetical protein NHX12_030371 [Muraenolepis orangiensis]